MPDMLHPDRLLPSDPTRRDLARDLYDGVKDLPLICPHGHTDPAWFAQDAAFPDPATLLITPDHYLTRMLFSQGVPLEALGVQPLDDNATDDAASPVAAPREVWRNFAAHYHVFRGTPSRLWFDHALHAVLGVEQPLSAATADRAFDHIAERLAEPAFRPRALYRRFNIEAIATTDAALDDLAHHRTIHESGWAGRVLPTFRPDAVIDPDYEGFSANVRRLGAMTDEDTASWPGYLNALRKRRAYFKALGATATDHGHPSAATADLPRSTCQELLSRALHGDLDHEGAERFRGQMLTEMAEMSVEDGLVMQIHVGSQRNVHRGMFRRFGRDKGFDIPVRADFLRGLSPLLNRFGTEPGFTLILFTLDETAYGRELAPLAGVFPCLKLGPPWWFFDSPEGMINYRRAITETAGFYNTAGFNDDTRAYLSIPARHDVARRMDCHYLATLVAEHRLSLAEAHEVAADLAYHLARRTYRLAAEHGQRGEGAPLPGAA